MWRLPSMAATRRCHTSGWSGRTPGRRSLPGSACACRPSIRPAIPTSASTSARVAARRMRRPATLGTRTEPKTSWVCGLSRATSSTTHRTPLRRRTWAQRTLPASSVGREVSTAQAGASTRSASPTGLERATSLCRPGSTTQRPTAPTATLCRTANMHQLFGEMRLESFQRI